MVNEWTLAYGFLVGPLAWFAHLAVSYLLETTRCVAGLRAADLWMHGVTLVALALVVAGGVVSWQAWQQLRPLDDDRGDTTTGRKEFMALSGVLLCGLFGLTILVGDLPTLFVEHCS